MFYSKSFTVLALKIRSLIHLGAFNGPTRYTISNKRCVCVKIYFPERLEELGRQIIGIHNTGRR